MIDELVDLKNVNLNSLSELETFFLEKNIPQEKIRFFVNEDRKDPKCFGIYQDVNTGNFIVYKNKSDGTRAVRYDGADEKMAVDIFFSKLKEEMAKRDNKKPNRNKPSLYKIILFSALTIIIVILVVGLMISTRPKTKYYVTPNRAPYCSINNNYYYYDDYYDDWYYYDGDISNFVEYDGDLKDLGVDTRFEDSSSYKEEIDSYEDSDYSDSDFDDYDFGSWDSSDTDWDSDW